MVGAHNNQPTDGSDRDRHSICGGGSGDGGSRGSGSGDGGNDAATARVQTVAAATAAREIYINSLTAMVAYLRPLFFELRASLITFRIFVR